MNIPLPNYTQTPNILYDEIYKTLKEGELRVIIVITRQTFGWHKPADRISLTQLAEKSGMDKSSVCRSLKSLIEKGLVEKKIFGTLGKERCYYSLVLENSIENSIDEIDEEDMCDEERELISNNSYQSPYNNPPVSVQSPPSLRKIHTKETNTKETNQKKKQQHAAETAAVFSYKHLERTDCSSEQELQATCQSNPFLQHNINYQTLPDNSKIELTKQSSELNKSIYNKPSQQSGNSGQLKIYSELKDIPIPEQEKVEITKRHSESVVKDAIAWATHPKNPPKKCLAASIKHACKHKYSAAEFSEPKKKVSVIEQIKRFFKHGEFYNNAECFVNYEYIAFQRGMRNESVPLDKYFSLDKFKNLCSSFQIKIPELA